MQLRSKTSSLTRGEDGEDNRWVLIKDLPVPVNCHDYIIKKGESRSTIMFELEIFWQMWLLRKKALAEVNYGASSPSNDSSQ